MIKTKTEFWLARTKGSCSIDIYAKEPKGNSDGYHGEGYITCMYINPVKFLFGKKVFRGKQKYIRTVTDDGKVIFERAKR